MRDQARHPRLAGITSSYTHLEDKHPRRGDIERRQESPTSRSRTLLSCAISAILAAQASEPSRAQQAALAGPSPASDEIGEIIVTAQRREEQIQRVPVSMQVLTGDVIGELNVTTFDDFIKYLPNVTSAGLGPGQSNIFMRGLSTGSQVPEGTGGLGSFPNVAVYLDEQSTQIPGHNLDIYAADLQRIEVLEGPQGTLFGAGAQAGVLRYITNKPKLDVTEAVVNGGYGTTAHGDPSSNVDATLNLPLIADTLALRMVIYDDKRGGYINNIPGTFNRSASDLVSVNYFSGAVPPNSGPVSNNAITGNAINPVTYQGLRAELLLKLNEDWNVLLMQSYQDMEADGVSYQEAYDSLGKTLPALSVQLFNPSYDKDKFEDTQLTVNGRIGDLKMIYTGAYLNRRFDQQLDYTNYSRGHYAGYYQCAFPGYPFKGGVATPGSAGYCWSPSAYWYEKEKNTHQSHELRLSTPDEWRWRAIAGIYVEDYKIYDNLNFAYGSSPYFVPIAPPADASANNPNPRPFGTAFLEDVTRGYKQKAVYLSSDFDLVPNRLTLTAGTRYYDISDFEVGASTGSFGCEIYGPYDGNVPKSPCTLPNTVGINLNALNLNKSYVGFKSRANVSWHVTDDRLLYYTWSQGFRPGGFNLGQGIIGPSSPLYGVFTPPLVFGPDTLTNNEIGWKTEWFGHRLQWNGALYQELWKDVQLTIFDPGITGNQAFDSNGPSYRVRGLESSFVARVTHALTVSGSASVNSGQVVKTVSLVNPNTGQPIPIENPYGNLGAPLALSPSFQGNIRARYETTLGDYQGFVQVGASHTGGSYSSTDHLTHTLQGLSIDFYDPAFTTYDAAVGVAKDAWTIGLYGENLTDTRGVPFSTYGEWVKSETVIRPRTLTVKLSYRFSENRK
ncbi:MAG: TonB-dependent receptor [Steroidobacteraceae bacterium]